MFKAGGLSTLRRLGYARALLCVLLMHIGIAGADIVISLPKTTAVPGAPLQLDLTITNEQTQPLILELPSPLHVRFESATAVSTLEFTPERSGRIEVAPREFARVRLTGTIPAQAQGTATLLPTGLETNYVMVQIDTTAAATNATMKSATATDVPASAQRPQQAQSKLVDKPPPLALSVYEPLYFIVGGDGGLNAKFQISFRYRLFDDKGKLASRFPWIDDLYLAFSQTSIWDLGDLSKPFKDSSYRPRLFFANYDLGRLFDGRLRLGVEAGAGHESNGKEADQSRSFNMFYVRPMLTGGDPDGLRFYLGPLIHNYVANDENPDLADYRGYVDWLVGVGSKGGLDFWATLRKGKRSNYGSAELNLSYPLSKLSGDLTGWLMLQYFGGYGESLLDYNRKLDSQLRLGIAVAL
jgi:outer membrane phospholipase A